MVNPRTAFLIQCLVFCVPLNVYVIGDYIGWGIQWALVRYQISYFGESLISFTNEIGYVYIGIIQGRSALVLLLWAIAVILLIVCFIVNLMALRLISPDYTRKTFLFTLLSGLLFLVADVMQYGITFHNDSGFCIPVGLPLLFVIGLWGYDYTKKTDQQTDQTNNSIQNIQIYDIDKSDCSFSLVKKDILFLISVSIFIKIILFFFSLYAPFYVVTGDIDLYYRYAGLFASGKIPYIDFSVEYPVFFFIPIMIAFIPMVFTTKFSIFLLSYMVLMYFIDAFVLILVYLIALRFFGQPKAYISGLLYTTAISAAFFIPLTFDIVPTFFLVLSLFLYSYRNKVSAYMTTSIGSLIKWFPVFSLPFFIIHSLKSRDSLDESIKGLIGFFMIIFFFTVPFLLVNYQVFLMSYFFHLSREVQSHSLIYYGDILCRLFFHVDILSQYSIVLLGVIEIALFYYYYRSPDKKLITLYYFVFLSVFFFVILNKVFSASYIIWLTPFFALFLVHSYRHIFLFYLIEIIIYIETPLLYRIVFGNGQPYYVFENNLPSISFVFYSFKFLLFLTIFLVIRNDLINVQSSQEYNYV